MVTSRASPTPAIRPGGALERSKYTNWTTSRAPQYRAMKALTVHARGEPSSSQRGASAETSPKATFVAQMWAA